MSSPPSPSPASSPPPPAVTPSTPPINSTSPPPTNSTPSPPPPAAATPSTSPPAPTVPAPSASPPPPVPSGSSPSPAAGSTPSPPPPSVTSSPPSPSSRSPPSPPVSRTPPSGRSPSPPTTPNSSAESPPTSGISTGLVVGIAAAGVFALVVLSILFIFCRKKRRRHRGSFDYYGHPAARPPKDDPYGRQPQNWQNNAPPPADHVVKMPPQPSPPCVHASQPAHYPKRGSTVPEPLVPPPAISSSGGSGSDYSGSDNPLPPPSPGVSLGFSKSTFTLQELSMATDGFSDANLLGQGGFGYVHRGILSNGTEVAVKSLKSDSGQGEREFQAEVEIISRVHHKHLVSLVGYCMAGGQRMLVYEFVTNNTLEYHLHGKGRPTMEWPIRLKIALGAAKGLSYLHEDCHPKIIHRDIKASNILLDFKFEAKVADFGLAKFASDNNTHVSTRVMGTFGYLAPEYASSGKLTDKSDVFSYGVMLLELITGRRPVDSVQSFMDDSMVDWARLLLSRALEDGNYDSLVDPQLQKNYNPSEMSRMVACAAACVRHSARRRPRMSQIVRALEGDVSLEALNEGVRPGNSSIYSSYGSSDSGQYNEDMKKFRKMALASQEYGSSECSGPATSEYGLNRSASSSKRQNNREMDMRKMRRDGRGFSGSP